MNLTLTRTGSTVVASALAAAMLLLAPAPAEAATTMTSTTWGKTLSTQWTQVDGTAMGGRFGNVHMGWLSADQAEKGKAWVYGSIEDWDCPEGELPYTGGHGYITAHDEPWPESPCTYVGYRWLQGESLRLDMTSKLETARLRGKVTVYSESGDGGHGGGEVAGQPYIDIKWKGVGSFGYERWSSSYSKDGVKYSDAYKSRFRDATMSGKMGAMGFDPALSSGRMATYTVTSTWRQP